MLDRCRVYCRGDAGKWRHPRYSRGIRQKYFRWEYELNFYLDLQSSAACVYMYGYVCRCMPIYMGVLLI